MFSFAVLITKVYRLRQRIRTAQEANNAIDGLSQSIKFLIDSILPSQILGTSEVEHKPQDKNPNRGRNKTDLSM